MLSDGSEKDSLADKVLCCWDLKFFVWFYNFLAQWSKFGWFFEIKFKLIEIHKKLKKDLTVIILKK